MQTSSETGLDLQPLLAISGWGLCLKEMDLNPHGCFIIFNHTGFFPSVSAAKRACSFVVLYMILDIPHAYIQKCVCVHICTFFFNCGKIHIT